MDTPGEYEGRIAKGKDWREIVAWVGDLPPMPHVAARAIQMVENPNTSAPELTEVLTKDAALAARVLKIANSAMFSRQREITTLNQAIMIIGLKALKGIIVAAALRQMNKTSGRTEQLIWENSMCTAMAATTVAKHLKRRYTEEIFLLGLLHSLGQIVLLFNEQSAADYKIVLKKVRDEHLDYVTAESQVFGFAHPLIGALVAKKWNFSADACQVILHYRDEITGDKPQSDLEEKWWVVQFSDALAHVAGVGSPEGYPTQIEVLKKIGLKIGFDPKTIDQDLEELINSTQSQFQGERHLYE